MNPLKLRILVIGIVVLFIFLLFIGKPAKAMSLLFIPGGILGLKTKTMPFKEPPKSPTTNYKIAMMITAFGDL